MSRLWPIALLIIIVLTLGAIIIGCEEDDEDDGNHYPNCTPPLEFLYHECDFYVTFDDVERVSIGEAWDSCQNAYGKMWRDFIHCWRRIDHERDDPCGQFASCLPDHGFYTSED